MIGHGTRAAVGSRTVLAVVARPDLWWAAVGVARRFAVPGWWRRWPYLPLPDADLWRFRMVTAYGDPTARPVPGDAVDYLEWCRDTAPSRVGPGRPGPRSRRRRRTGVDG